MQGSMGALDTGWLRNPSSHNGAPASTSCARQDNDPSRPSPACAMLGSLGMLQQGGWVCTYSCAETEPANKQAFALLTY